MKKTHILLLASLIAVGALGTLAITSNAAPAFVSGVDASHHITYTNSNIGHESALYFIDVGDEDGYIYYWTELELYDSYGADFTLNEIHLYFSC